MVWICRHCGSENRRQEAVCAACLRKAGVLYRHRRPRRTDAVENVLLDRWIRRAGALSRRMKSLRGGLLLLLLTAMVLTGSRVLTTLPDGGYEISNVWQPRWLRLQKALITVRQLPEAELAAQRLHRIGGALSEVHQTGTQTAQHVADRTLSRLTQARDHADENLTTVTASLSARWDTALKRLKDPAVSIARQGGELLALWRAQLRSHNE